MLGYGVTLESEFSFFFFFNDTATTEIYTLSLTRRSSDLSVPGETRKRSACASQKTFDPEGADLDRKSTRLNSSHSQISYAVFCLKKKKEKQRACGFLELCSRFLDYLMDESLRA